MSEQNECKSFGKCGACSYIHKDYAEQLDLKHRYVQGLFGGMKAEPVLGMDDPTHYRHKVYATFGRNPEKKIVSGLYAEGSHRLVYENDCLIQNETANRIIRSVTSIASSMHIEPYSERWERGVLRHIYLRVSHATGKVLMVLVIGSRELPGSRVFLHRIKEENPEVESIVINWNNHVTSMILGQRDKVLIGSGSILDEIDGMKFRISSRSFYQVNPVQTEVLYHTAIEMADLKPTDHVLDACCGIGTISLLAAKHCAHVTGVELVNAAVEDARENAKLNGVNNCDFVCSDIEEYMERHPDKFHVVFLDPPRSGVTEPFMDALIACGPRRIVYVSCNPETQTRDTKYLRKAGYVIQKIQPVDMFPFTKHIENVVLMSKISK